MDIKIEKNRPNKPGYWWYEIKPDSRYGDFEIADFMGLSDKSFRKQILDIESDPVFVRWNGMALPPIRDVEK